MENKNKIYTTKEQGTFYNQIFEYLAMEDTEDSYLMDKEGH